MLRSFPGLRDFAVGTLNFRAYGPFPGCYMTSSSLTIDDSSPIQVISRSRFKENQESHRTSTLEAEKTEQSLKNTQLPPRSPSPNRNNGADSKKGAIPTAPSGFGRQRTFAASGKIDTFAHFSYI